MAASTLTPLPPGIRIYSQYQNHRVRKVTPICYSLHRSSFAHPARLQSRALCKPLEVKMQIGNARERFFVETPEVIRDFPWKKAPPILFQQLLFTGQEVLKWFFLTLFFCSSVLDILLSISRNKELMIPCGLFAGCMISNFLKEVSQELFHTFEEKTLKWQLLSIGFFFILMKFTATYFIKGRPMFLVHFANGGLIQVLWLLRGFVGEKKKSNAEASQTDPPSDTMNTT